MSALLQKVHSACQDIALSQSRAVTIRFSGPQQGFKNYGWLNVDCTVAASIHSFVTADELLAIRSQIDAVLTELAAEEQQGELSRSEDRIAAKDDHDARMHQASEDDRAPTIVESFADRKAAWEAA